MTHSTLHFAIGLVIGTIGGLPWIWHRIIMRQPVAHMMKRWILISWILAFIAIFPNLLRQIGVSENIISSSWMNVFLFHTTIARLNAGGIVRGGVCIVFCFVLQYSSILIAINRIRRYIPQYQPTIKLMTILLFLLPIYEQCSATEYYVTTNGSYENNGLSWTSAWPTITHAISMVSSGDVINVGVGEFIENILVDKPLHIRGNDTLNTNLPPLSRHTSQTILRPPVSGLLSAMVEVVTNNVKLSSFTIDCGQYSNVFPEVRNGVYCEYRPLTISNCTILNVQGFAIRHYGLNPEPSPSDNDALRSYIGYSLISNVTHQSSKLATGILVTNAAFTCEHNEIVSINGSNAYAGTYVFKCGIASNMSSWIKIDNNYYSDCETALWANKFAAYGEKILIRNNTITNSAVGIRITAARGQANISGNNICVGGTTTGGEPSRGIWIEADWSPWDTTNYMTATDHQVISNNVTGAVTPSGSIGMHYSYRMTTPPYDNNNGVRATVINNTIYSFATGIIVESGTEGVRFPHTPLVEVIIRTNQLYANTYCGLLATGVTEQVDASNNWWGWGTFANGAKGMVNGSNWIVGRVQDDTDNDGINDWQDTDDDNDGSPDWDELIAGTDVQNPTSVFKIISFTCTNGVEIGWNGVAERLYSVYRTTNLLDGFNEHLTNQWGIPGFNMFIDSSATSNVPFYYKLTVQW